MGKSDYTYSLSNEALELFLNHQGSFKVGGSELYLRDNGNGWITLDYFDGERLSWDVVVETNRKDWHGGIRDQIVLYSGVER